MGKGDACVGCILEVLDLQDKCTSTCGICNKEVTTDELTDRFSNAVRCMERSRLKSGGFFSLSFFLMKKIKNRFVRPILIHEWAGLGHICILVSPGYIRTHASLRLSWKKKLPMASSALQITPSTPQKTVPASSKSCACFNSSMLK